MQRNIFEHGLVGRAIAVGFDSVDIAAHGGIGKSQVAEIDFAANFLRSRSRDRIVDLRLGIKNVIQAPHGCAAALKNVGDEAERDHRENQSRHERVERDQLAERDAVHHHLAAALPQAPE